MKARRFAPVSLCVTLVLAAGGCTSIREYLDNGFKVGPNYRRPAAPVADEWIDSTNPRLIQGPADHRNWWTVFRDPTLDRLVAIAYQQNITLREAGFRVAEAQSQRRIAAGLMFPQSQQILADYTRTQRSTETAFFAPVDPSSPVPSLGVSDFSDWRIGASLSWELDFWGRYRRSIEAADARLDASIEDYDDALVLLVSEVAISYVELRSLQERLKVARENAELQRESARIAQARLDLAAADSEVDAPQAKSNLARTLATIQTLEIARRRAEHRLAVLMGMPPHDLAYLLAGEESIPSAPEDISVGIPAELIRRRPDVRRAERLVAAQSAEIGVAESDLYPSISISGVMVQESAQLPDLFKSRAFGGVVGPALRWNVLNYGRLMSNVAAQDARLEQLISSYQQTVLQANEEAENAIAAFLHHHEQIGLLEESVREAREAVRVTKEKYEGGAIDFNRLFNVEQLLREQQDRLAVARGDLAQSVIQLYKALGGGWEIRLEPMAAELAPVVPANEPPPAPEPIPQPSPGAPQERP